ncbi:MAG: hypothetical protein HC913_11225 [Microscillaceae bacterium]|nr:hypothetical protein [Microscillaceae bacterium]
MEQKSEKLERAYAQIHDSVVYASRIQKSILMSEEEVVRHFKDGFVLLCPRDIVSGDFIGLPKSNWPRK